MPARILVTCGSGIGTSRAVARKLEGILSARGLDVEVVPTDDTHLTEKLEGAIAYVPLVKPQQKVDVPVVLGYPFLVGTGEEAAIEELVSLVEAANKN